MQSDVYVHATRFEGRSIAVQEAQVLGCAIVLSNCSGNRLQVIPGKDGLLCELAPESIAKTIALLLDNPEMRERLGKAAMEKNQPTEQDIGELLYFFDGGE